MPHLLVRSDKILDEIIDEFLQGKAADGSGEIGQNKRPALHGLYLVGDTCGTDLRLKPMANALAIALGNSRRVEGNYRSTVGH